MDAEVAYADCRLDAWSSWVRGGMSSWPSLTLLGRIIEQGANGAAQTGRSVEGMPDEILATDRAVARLDVILKRTVKVYYLTYADIGLKAQRCGCSKATFWRRVTRAQRAVGYYLRNGETQDYIPQLASG